MRRNLGLTSLVAAATLVFVTLQPAEAVLATGHKAYAEWERVQVNEPLKVFTEDPCMNPTEEYDYGYEGIFANLQQPSSSTDIDLGLIAQYDEFGVWYQGILRIPDVPSGIYNIVLTCRVFDGYDPTVTTTYDAFNIEVVDNNLNQMALSRTNWLDTLSFSSVTPCQPYETVDVSVYQSSFDVYNGQYAAFVTRTVSTNASGHWSGTLSLTPGERPAFFWDEGGEVFVRARCLADDPDPDFVYDSYAFTMGAPEYVALGDSYSSGTGSGNDDIAGGEACHKSTDAYPFYISSRLGISTPVMGACHGAVTDDITGDPLTGQISLVTEKTRYITLTIGGNDAGFERILNACIDRTGLTGYGCSIDTSVTGPNDDAMLALSGLWGAPYENPATNREVHPIKEVLSALHEAAPYALIYIAGYPRLFGASTFNYLRESSAPGGFTCVVNTAPISLAQAKVSYSDAQWLNGRVDLMNTIINNAVVDLREELDEEETPYAYYVSPSWYSAGGFAGHGLCDWYTPYLHDVDLLPGSFTPTPESFHPTLDGIIEGYGEGYVRSMTPGE